MSDNENFDELFAEIMGGDAPAKTAVIEAIAENAVKFVAAPAAQVLPEVIKAVVDSPVPVEVPKQKYQADAGKVLVEGAPCETMIYSAGYCRLKWPNPRFANQAVLYRDQLEEMEQFFQSEGYKTWKEAAINAGLRKRGEARKES